jgi:hypothetical protein
MPTHTRWQGVLLVKFHDRDWNPFWFRQRTHFLAELNMNRLDLIHAVLQSSCAARGPLREARRIVEGDPFGLLPVDCRAPLRVANDSDR